MDWFVFFLVMGNIIINAIVLNSNIKDRVVLQNFVENTQIMSVTYKEMALKYNEMALGMNEVIKKGNNQADIIESMLAGLLADERLAPEALQWLTAAQQKMAERENGPVDSSDQS